MLEEGRRCQGAPRWGISFVSLAVAMGLLEEMGARDLTLGAAAALTGIFGLGRRLAWGFNRPIPLKG